MTKESEQLDIFDLEPQDVLPKGDEASLIAPKKRRKKREAKKAPMIVDAFDAASFCTGTGPSCETTSEGETPSPPLTRRFPTPVSPEGPVPVQKDEESGFSQKEAPTIYTVSEITDNIKAVLEDEYPDVWVCGEVTDFRNRTGRHLYFSIKDAKSKLRVVIFNADNRLIPFELKDGQEIVCHGKLNVYGPQGYYSIIVDYIEPKGIGALQLAFEQLKKKLEAEGLFDASRKKKLPYLPKKIGVITSPTGAAIRDIVHVLTRRFPNIEILLYPVRVQGEGAAAEIANAIGEMNLRSDLDLLIIGRGGGSIEDLWAFNEEIVARAIAASRLPTISAVGHEIDFTIADFVADRRAATPSAAAEIAIPVREDLLRSIHDYRRKLIFALNQAVVNKYNELKRLAVRLADPRRKLPDLLLKVDSIRQRIIFAAKVALEKREQMLSKFASNLDHLSPLGVLAKGYSVVENTAGIIVKSSADVNIGDSISVRLHQGRIGAKVVTK